MKNKEQIRVDIYTKDNCGQCNMTKKLFKHYDIAYFENSISSMSSDEIDVLKEKGFGHAPIVSFSYLESSNGYSWSQTGMWSGFNPEAIKKLAVIYGAKHDKTEVK
ncbi:glutaredoxin [Lactobacillus phage ATCC 8014-B2]|uniref:Glutaredoxin n=1 Tax=Lactobacillus phage ATCC 8014-B2 TaxID=1225795 RepID=K4I0H0_9CAUD|nr:thioredoxin domain [Lactobacillus phage ATCC 8014-B2]AFU63133.1 glutaredoxin [Lactobacillus phage ATCC 8014-B2]